MLQQRISELCLVLLIRIPSHSLCPRRLLYSLSWGEWLHKEQLSWTFHISNGSFMDTFRTPECAAER